MGVAERLIFNNLDDIKSYLRQDADDDDVLIELLVNSAERKVMKIAGKTEEEFAASANTMKLPVLYATAYFYEHREEADHKELDLTLRALLAQERDVPL